MSPNMNIKVTHNRKIVLFGNQIRFGLAYSLQGKTYNPRIIYPLR